MVWTCSKYMMDTECTQTILVPCKVTKNVDARWLDTQELTESVTGEVYHITDLKNVSGIKRHGVRPGGPTSKREMVHLSAGHPVHGHKEEPGKPIPNNYAYWGGNVYKDDRPDLVIITLDVKMLREKCCALAD